MSTSFIGPTPGARTQTQCIFYRYGTRLGLLTCNQHFGMASPHRSDISLEINGINALTNSVGVV